MIDPYNDISLYDHFICHAMQT